MECPYCSEKMEAGKITASESFHWQPGITGGVSLLKARNSNPPKGGVAISKKLRFTSYKCIAHYCKACDKVIIDLKERDRWT